MRQKPTILFLCTLVGIALFVCSTMADDNTGLTREHQVSLPTYFGFAPLEIIKLDDGVTQLRLADFNNDGAMDMTVANNKKSTIEVLIQRTVKPESGETSLEVNELADHWRYDRKKVSITWEVSCLQAADVTADENPDLIFFGKPGELVILPGRGDGTFESARTRRVLNGLTLPGCLDVADLNGDGRTDIVLLSDEAVLFFFQQSDGTLTNPKRFPHSLENPLGLTTADLDGDGMEDLIIATDEEGYPLRIRMQQHDGEFGAVERVRLPALRSIEFADTFFQIGVDIFGVERISGRLRRWHLSRQSESKSENHWAVLQIPIPGGSDGNAMPLAIGDLNGDKFVDIVTADTDAAQLALQLQQPNRGLSDARLFGGQIDMTDARCFDADGDGIDELYVCSPQERSIAKSEFEGRRLTFPKAIKTFEKPFALDIAKPTRGTLPALAYVSRDEDSTYWLTVQPLDATRDQEPIAQIELEDMDEPPAAVRWIDADNDGRRDVLIFSQYAPLVAAMQAADGSYSLIENDGESQTGLVNDARIQAFAFADTTGDGQPEILLAQKSFVRALRVNDGGAWEILDQYNAPTSQSELTGLCVLSNDQRPTIATYDRRGKEVLFLKPNDAGTYELDRKVQVGALEVKSMHGAPFGGTAVPSVLLSSSRGLTIILPDREGIRAIDKGVYESSLKDAHLSVMAVGDVNHDRVSDIGVIDVRNHFVEILTFAPDESLIRGNKFRVFAQKQFRRRGQESSEPRWIEMSDVTNDGNDDLVLIAHDRILVYPGQ